MKKILIIDDEPSIVEIISQYAHRLGYPSDSADDGKRAVNLVARNAYWAVFCDLKLPGMDGMEIFEKIKGLSSEFQDRLVLLTGTLLDEAIEDRVNKDHVIVLRKPFNFNGIKEIFNRLESR